MRRQVRRVVDALHRDPIRPMHDADATEMLQELERGRWTIVEHIDRDHRRYLVARENVALARSAHALTQREREVVEYARRGWSNKVIAFELRVSTSTVSTHLSRVAAKLGAKSRTVLIQMFGALGATRRSAAAVEYITSADTRFAVIALTIESRLPASLSPAEREVAGLAIAGKSNAEIAQARGVSRRTVENQLAAAMKKLGASSRAELAAVWLTGAT